jgi:hypothetical protein
MVHSSSEWLIPKHITLRNKAIFDLGVVDFDNDGFLDVFTTNHASKQSLLRNSGSIFVEVAEDFDLFPSWGSDPSSSVNDNDPPGLYIYKQGDNIKFVASKPQSFMSDEMTISIILLHRWEIESHENFEITRQSLPDEYEYKTDRLILRTIDTAEININKRNNAYLPLMVSLSENIPLENVFIGAERRTPKSHEITLKGHDRHGVAWFNIDQKGFLDAFIVRGGLSNNLKDHVGVVHDELFILNQGDTKQMAEVFEIKKSGCRAREAGWVDINNDNKLDIYIGCQFGENQAHIQGDDGLFEDKAAELLLNEHYGEVFVWLDVDRDDDMDLVFAEERGGYWLYRNEPQGFVAEYIGDKPVGIVNHFSVQDFDLDGDADIFVSSNVRNDLLINTGQGFKRVLAVNKGLPDRSATASWVDYDNDGRIELHVMPGGIFSQNDNGQWHIEQKLIFDLPLAEIGVAESRMTWFDADNDGDRDLIVAWKASIFDKQWTHQFYLNSLSSNNWISISLEGPKTNLQSIGAWVTLTLSDGKQVSQQVGWSENSHFSQGHYRLYFGLGTETTIKEITARWPDGTQTTRSSVQPNQNLTILYP